MILEDLGYNSIKPLIDGRKEHAGFEIGRVVAEHRERYLLGTATGEVEAEITGNMRYAAKNREDFPAVGDWVTFIPYDPGFAIIHEVLPRFSVLKRQAVGRYGETQVIGANIDYALIMQSVGRDYNMNRLERYLTICYSSKVNPIAILTKTDLIGREDLTFLIGQINKRFENLPVIAISNQTKDGYDEISGLFESGKTYCMLGSSGVGKSTLLNNLSGKTVMKTAGISNSTKKGRHVSTHRELTVLKNGGILIDNPGMKEVGIVAQETGLDTTYDKIAEHAQNCRFKDCTHASETGCAVIEAVENGEIEKSHYQNFLKLEKEKEHFELSVRQKRQKDKDFGKMVRNIKKDLKKKRY